MIKRVSNLDPVDGIFLLDKPQGYSSFAAVKMVKHIFSAEKAGHTGTLDPMATGMLPICLGEATKFSQFLLNDYKTYEAIGEIGFATDTGDITGEVIATSAAREFSITDINQCLNLFLGEITQTPPMYSALKYQGKPLYIYARRGQEIQRKNRPVKIIDLTLLAMTKNSFKIRATVSKGTYIRTLIDDIAIALGTRASMSYLKRISIAGLEEKPMYTLDSLQKMTPQELSHTLFPAEIAVSNLLKLVVTHADKLSLYQGKIINYPHPLLYEEETTLISLWDSEDKFFGVGQYFTEGFIKAKRLWRKTNAC